MSSLYIFNHPNATKLIPSSREEILANEPILLALDQNFDFESLRGYIVCVRYLGGINIKLA